MRYEFPRIVHISQALEAIKGDEDLFYVVEKEGYIVINYKLPCNKTFPPVTDRNIAIRRELRGIKFDSITGETIARVFHKFFNYGEREETLANNIDLSIGYDRLEKLDGSMVHPLFLPQGVRWATKMGVTDTSMQTEVWLAGNPNDGLNNFLGECSYLKLTPIFEWCSRLNRIVVDHPVDRLVLTAVRENYSGAYTPYSELKWYRDCFDIDLVERCNDPIKDIVSYSESIYELKSDVVTEGEVLRFSDGHMLKVKSEDYINLHRTKDKIQKERHFVAILLNQQLDDLKPFMLAEDLAKAEAYEVILNQNVNALAHEIFHEVNAVLKAALSRKDFAIGNKSDPLVKQIIFHLWDRDFPLDTIHDELMRRLKEACESEQKFERLRPTLLKGTVW